jgi:hypothetical protein
MLKKLTARSLITEAHVQKSVVDYLQWDGWRAIRTDPVSDRQRGKGFGEIGMPDYLFVRYKPTFRASGMRDIRLSMDDTVAQVLWIEFKRPGQKPRPRQMVWHDAERARGALVLVVDDFDSFRQWYSQSRLERTRD